MIVGQKRLYATRMAHNDENSPPEYWAKSGKTPQSRWCYGATDADGPQSGDDLCDLPRVIARMADMAGMPMTPGGAKSGHWLERRKPLITHAPGHGSPGTVCIVQRVLTKSRLGERARPAATRRAAWQALGGAVGMLGRRGRA